MKRAALVLAVASVGAVTAREGRGEQGEPPWVWADTTTSPAPLAKDAQSDRESELQAACGIADHGLWTVAKRLVARKLRTLAYLDIDGLSFAQRVAGEPHVWPRAFLVSGRALDHATTLERIRQWRRTAKEVGERRCGVATGYAEDGTEVVAAIAVDALGDLAPLPVRARVGAWLTIDATLLVPARDAHVLVLGPSGEPHTVPTSFDRGHVRAHFVLDRAGQHTVQVVADVATGPRPIVEAELFADVDPPTTTPNLAAPGEDAGAGLKEPSQALAAMIAAVRAGEGLSPLVRDARLAALAMAHARHMIEAHTIGHDVGDGDPAERLQRAGLRARETGENVAHAPTLQLAHRALYASPSHRSNLLGSSFDRVGVAVIDDADGSVWVAEMFASTLR